MKGQPEPLVKRAIGQAQREADLLYLLVIYTNVAVLEEREHRRREYYFLLASVLAQRDGSTTKKWVQIFRLVVLVFIKSVLILDAAIAQVVSERLDGQPLLFRDSTVKLEEQLQMAEQLTGYFNVLARAADTAEINLEELRKSLQSEADRQVSLWTSLAHMNAFGALGNSQEMHAAMDRLLLLCESKSSA